MSEWLKEHAWKACVGETLPRVRIPLSPPNLPIQNANADGVDEVARRETFSAQQYPCPRRSHARSRYRSRPRRRARRGANAALTDVRGSIRPDVPQVVAGDLFRTGAARAGHAHD